MATKGSGGSRRWIPRQSIDTRPIVGMYDVPAWQRALEAIAPWGCLAVAAATGLICAYAFLADLIAGHL